MYMQYKRILLKLSGEALMGEQQYGIDPKRLELYAEQIQEVVDKGVEVAIVIGGGNIFRGVAGASSGMDRVQGDHMGMLATIINGLVDVNRDGVPDVYVCSYNKYGQVMPNSWSDATNGTPNLLFVSDGAGGAVITWTDVRPGGVGIYAQRVDASGTVQWTVNGAPICTAPTSSAPRNRKGKHSTLLT